MTRRKDLDEPFGHRGHPSPSEARRPQRTRPMDTPHQHVTFRFRDGRQAEFVAANSSRAWDWARTMGPVTSWSTTVTREPITRKSDMTSEQILTEAGLSPEGQRSSGCGLRGLSACWSSRGSLTTRRSRSSRQSHM